MTPNLPFLSIITVTFNAENFLQPTIESVASQSEGDYEHILIDGNSEDNTLNIAKRHSEHFACILSEPDNGVYDAMNKGVKLAKGKYVLFLNAGDELASPQTIADLKNLDGADIIYGETIILNPTRKPLGTRSELTSRKLPKTLSKKSFLNGQAVSHQSFIAKRDLCPSYDLKYSCSADIDWQIKVLSRASVIRKTEAPISKYLQGGISDTQLKKCWMERFKILLEHFFLLQVLISHVHFAIRYLMQGAYKRN